jgi:signal transduction histidine kinase
LNFCFHLITAMTIFPAMVIAQPDYPDPGWADVQRTKKGSITVYWHESRPFVYRDKLGNMQGIEYDILQGFPKFLKETKGIDLRIIWKEGKSFSDTYSTIRDKKTATFGASAFSITEKREKEVDFSPPYMSDISVLITSEGIPIMKNMEEFNAVIPKLTAITIEETTYEQELMRLQHQGNLPFDIKYIPSSENIVRRIAMSDSAFGFIDLPVYMMLFNENPSIKIKRQNLLPIKREGYALLLRENSDWKAAIQEYFSSTSFKSDLEKNISKYIDLDLYHFVEGLAVHSDNHTVMLLTKEKEIQYKDLVGKTAQVMEETRKRNFFIVLMSVTLFFLILTAVQYRKRNEQKEQIEAQRKSIEEKSVQLEYRNNHLLALDEEKNNLIKILAHDLRTPITQIQGLAQLVILENRNMGEDEKSLVTQIVDTSVRVNKMISHLLDLDSLESNRVTVLMDRVNIRTLAEKVVASFEKQAVKKDIRISFHPLCSDCHIKGDSLFLIQIIENLISNAIKFSPRQKQVQVIVHETNNIVLSVKDQGPGMTADDLSNVFKKFQKLSARPTGGEESFGLGLSIVKKYVDLMGGRVWCESEPGKGTTFFVEFNKA